MKGSSSRSGPPPDPMSLASSKGEWVTLPATGRDGPCPVWPLAEPTERELEVWEREWCRPQAIMWEAQGQTAEVAHYVRAFVVAERHDASVASRTLLRQLTETLGVSIPGMQRNHWKIGTVTVDEPDTATDDPRSRLTVVAGGGS